MSLNQSHIPYERLVDWLDARLPDDQVAAITAHLTTCTRCRDEAARIERMVAAMRADASRDAPPALIARAVQLFRPRAAAPAPSLLERLVATLRFETTPLTPALGLRAEGSGPRQLVFAAGDYDLDLRIASSPAGWVVSGQVLGGHVVGGECSLRSEELEFRAPIDAASSFSLPPVPAGRFTLTLTWNATAVVVDELRLGSDD